MPAGTYYRFQPTDDVYGVRLDETSTSKLEELRQITVDWIESHPEMFEGVKAALSEQEGV